MKKEKNKRMEGMKGYTTQPSCGPIGDGKVHHSDWGGRRAVLRQVHWLFLFVPTRRSDSKGQHRRCEWMWSVVSGYCQGFSGDSIWG